MTTTYLEAVLAAAEMLLSAREDDMVTTEEWDALAGAVQAAREPAPGERTETFGVDARGMLVRRVVPRRGEPYEHRCPLDAYEAVARAADEAKAPFNLEDLRAAADVPWTQAAVAFAFLKERGSVVPAGGRDHRAARLGVYEDAMIEYHALREGAQDDPGSGR